MNISSGRRRFLATEVIQTSSMDCGPAALKSLLEGFRVSVSYGRLREACQTDVDGTSIDTLEEVAQQAGVEAEQVMLPPDHVLLRAADALPAIAAVRSSSGGAHFLVIWRKHGPLVQIMDPARGRLWISHRSLLNQLIPHSHRVPAEAWRDWAGSDAFLDPLRQRLRAVGVAASEGEVLITNAIRCPDWQPLATLDAGTRMIASLQAAKALSRSVAYRTLMTVTAAGGDGASGTSIPEQYWTVRAVASDATALMLRGAVLVRARKRRPNPAEPRAHDLCSPGIAAALRERPMRPLRDMAAILRDEGTIVPGIAALALTMAVLGVVFEATLLRSLIDVGAALGGPEQGWWAGAVLTVFAAALLSLEMILGGAERRIGHHLEARLRISFLDKIPRLPDAYFQTRPISDMLERSHAVHTVRMLPRLGIRFVRVGLELGVTTLALIWLNPGTAGLAALAALAAAGIPLLGQSVIAERDLRARTHTGSLVRYHLDALRGRTAIEAHGASATMEREHEGLLAEWASASLSLQRASTAIEGLQMMVGFGLAAWLLLGHLGTDNSPGLLLQTYWMLNLPGLGYELALIAREYPGHRSTMLRLLEPLGAQEASRVGDRLAIAETGKHTAATAARIDIRHVTVQVAGHAILEKIDLQIAPGSHVAIIGASGAGKSTLVGLLLGWHRPVSGEVLVDGEPLSADHLDALRQCTAWVDPTVRLWNAPLLDNLLYGSETQGTRLAQVLDLAGLLPVVAKLPDGLATPLGEGGALLSAGEAQRVRFGRALMKDSPRLVLLDEPFLGLERDRRRTLLSHARQRWAEATVIYVTHDIVETRGFDRVVVVDHGRIAEDGDPRQLAQMPSSRYRRLLQTQESTLSRLAANTEWRRIRLESGRVTHDHARSDEQTA